MSSADALLGDHENGPGIYSILPILGRGLNETTPAAAGEEEKCYTRVQGDTYRRDYIPLSLGAVMGEHEADGTTPIKRAKAGFGTPASFGHCFFGGWIVLFPKATGANVSRNAAEHRRKGGRGT